eukprot:14155270-Alexandrium_andersonii.AAC.1
MSASLVGSEMCIRDRPPTPARRTRRPVWLPLAHRQPRRTPGRTASPAPVSYTHLTLPTICSV